MPGDSILADPITCTREISTAPDRVIKATPPSPQMLTSRWMIAKIMATRPGFVPSGSSLFDAIAVLRFDRTSMHEHCEIWNLLHDGVLTL
jgi:hypothetical protein